MIADNSVNRTLVVQHNVVIVILLRKLERYSLTEALHKDETV
jgi:broad specificity phosphatase PhoE